MKKSFVVSADDVAPYCPAVLNGKYESRLLVCPDGAGSSKLSITQATVKPGVSSGEGEVHPTPYDESFYILRGKARVDFPDENKSYEAGPDTAVFIPAGTKHRIVNIGEDDLVFLGLMPIFPMEEGINPVIDARRRDWGTSFRMVCDE